MEEFLIKLPKKILVKLLVSMYQKLTLVKFNLDKFKAEFENENGNN